MMQPRSDQPILYSFRRCPYAMRARLAIACSGTLVELREVVLRNKPESLLGYSPKGTVPVLILPDGKVIDQSIDIMHWALAMHDPARHLYGDNEALLRAQATHLIHDNDHEFKQALDRYKYPDRYPEATLLQYRAQGELFLLHLEQCLESHAFLISERMTLADIAIAPFVRQFAQVDEAWFERSSYVYLQRWLSLFKGSVLFNAVMNKYPPWHSGADITYFPQNMQ